MKASTRNRLRLTIKQKEARRVVDDFIDEKGYPPSYREVQMLLALGSVNTAYYRLRGYRHKMIQS